jgi:pyrroloquinoline quinone (PQQ) biosynthesis protein C
MVRPPSCGGIRAANSAPMDRAPSMAGSHTPVPGMVAGDAGRRPATPRETPSMDAATLETAVRARLRDRMLLDHPFYRRWSEGGVGVEELRAYAAQYRHFEAMLPAHLESVAAAAEHPALRAQALRNLADEAGAAPTHLDLFERFARAIDAPAHAEPSPAMAHLLDTCRDAARRGAAPGFAALLAYEIQAPGVASSKAAGLREHASLDGDALDFWDVHARIDSDHASWAVQALAGSGANRDGVVHAAGAAADAWWSFLDEREALHTSS